MKAKEFLIRAGKLLSAVLFLSAGLGMVAKAAESTSVKIPVKVNISGNAPEETYKITMEVDPASENAAITPVASPSELTVTSAGPQQHELDFNEITYTRKGDYQYFIKQTAGNKSYFTYDQTVYTVLVKVMEFTKDANDNPVPPYLAAVALVGTGEDLAKKNEIVFNNGYSRGSTPGNPGGGGNRPPSPGTNTPDPKVPTVQGENRPLITTPDVTMKKPDVLGVLRQVATGDGSVMALYGMFALVSMISLLFWGLGQKKKQKKVKNVKIVILMKSGKNNEI